MVYKTNESIIVIQAEATNPNNTDVVFWSHDRGTAKLRMKLVRKNGIPQSLPEGTTVPIRLMFKSATAEGGYGKHDYLATVEDPVNGIVSIVLEDNILGYVGTVEGSVYIDFPNDRSLDTAGRFTFYIKRSPIDDSTPELEDYYFNGFSQTIDKIEQIVSNAKTEIGEKVAESETQIDAKLKDTNDKITKANQDVATLNTNIDKANDRIDQTNQQIGDLGKLKKMYSNSIDFGDYDYSGRANLMPNLDFSKLSGTNYMIQTPPPYIKDGGTYFVLDASDASAANTARNVFIPFLGRLEKGAAYMVTIPMMISEDFGTDYGASAVYPYNVNDGATTTRTLTMTPNADCRGKWQFINKAFTVPSNMADGKFAPYLHVYQNANQTGKLYIGYDIKIEKVNSTSDTATPYQPNLLDAPYYLSKVPLGENIANKSVTFPIKTSAYAVYSYKNTENFIVGEKYVLTIKATKSATQTFNVRNVSNVFGDMKPVEGLTNIWVLEFTPTSIDKTYPAMLDIYQMPSNNVGAVQIDWLKIEKGDKRTPNIQQYKYFGEGLKDSNNPNDYSWDITPEYAEKGLNNAVNVYDPQRVEGLKNFADGIQIAGDKVISENDCTVYTLTKDNSQSFIDGYATFIKHGKEVIVNGTVKFKKAYAFGVPLDDEVPDEFIARIVHGMLTGQSGTNSVSKAMYVQKDLGTIMTNSEFAANEWFTFHGNYWVGVK